MVDHEGKVKEIQWHFEQTGPSSGEIFPTVHEYAAEDAPARLMPGDTPQPCVCAAAATAAVGAVPTVTALEACLVMVLVGALLAFLYMLLSMRRPPQPDTPAQADDPTAPIVLADFPCWPERPPGSPTCSNSSFVTKVEALLRFADVRYSKQVGYPDAASSPKAQLPFIERGDQRVGDSFFIIKHLISSGVVPAELEFPPSTQERAVAIAVARMCDTDLATAILGARWVDDDGWARCRTALMGPYRLPPGVAWVVARMARKACLTRVVEQGFGRHSEADRLALVREELGALAALLGSRPFLFGDAPHAADASLFGVLDQMAARELNPQLAELLGVHPNLLSYCERIRAKFFGKEYEREVQWLDGPATAVPHISERHAQDTKAREEAATTAGPASRPGKGKGKGKVLAKEE